MVDDPHSNGNGNGNGDGKPDPRAHLRKYQFKPGQSGNPSGRPKGSLGLWARIRKELKKQQPDGRIMADLVAEAFVRKVQEGDFRFLKELLDREEGPVAQEVRQLDTVASAVAAAEEARLADEE